MRGGTIAVVVVIAVVILYMGIGLLGGEGLGANVAIIPLYGPISTTGDAGLFASGAGSSEIVRFIEEADANAGIEIILLEINSPGGSAVASDEIARAVENVDKPVLAWIREAGASGAYWVASESDYIIANRMSITGSVGVLASYIEVGGFLEDHNITYQRITGGEYKDMGSPFAQLTEEEREILQKKIDTIHQFFLDDVQENRNLSDDQREEIETGIFLLGYEARELGLVDELGGRDEVQEWLKNELGEDPVYRRYEKPKGLFSSLGSVKSPSPLQGLKIQS